MTLSIAEHPQPVNSRASEVAMSEVEETETETLEISERSFEILNSLNQIFDEAGK